MAKELLPQAAVIFGASGDLTKRKLLPAFWHLWLQRRLPKGFALVGYARSAITSEEFRQSAFDDITKFAKHPPEGESAPIEGEGGPRRRRRRGRRRRGRGRGGFKRPPE